MHKHELAILNALKKPRRLNLDSLLREANLKRDEATWALENLSQSGFVSVAKEERTEIEISEEGEKYSDGELPEQALIRRAEKTKIEASELRSKEEQIGLMWAKKKGLVTIDGHIKLTEKGKKAAKDGIQENKILKELSDNKNSYAKYKNSETIQELEKRGLIRIKAKEEIKEIEITQQGILALAKELQSEAPEIEALDRSTINTRAWVGKKFKPYNIETPVEPREMAVRHPLRRFIGEIKQAYTSLGFKEVSGPVIDSSFWVLICAI